MAHRFQNPLINAIHIAIRLHDAQVDKAGQPYIEHLFRVLDVVMKVVPKDVEAHCAAVLHDAVEDTGTTLDELEAMGVPRISLELIHALTKPDNVPHIVYVRSLKEANGYIGYTARLIKMADLLDNSDPARLALIDDQKTRERLEEKYTKAIDVLTKRK